MYKIAVLGDAQSVQGFAALGLQVCPAENAEQRHASCNYKKPRFPGTPRHRKNDTPVLFLHMPQ